MSKRASQILFTVVEAALQSIKRPNRKRRICIPTALTVPSKDLHLPKVISMSSLRFFSLLLLGAVLVHDATCAPRPSTEVSKPGKTGTLPRQKRTLGLLTDIFSGGYGDYADGYGYDGYGNNGGYYNGGYYNGYGNGYDGYNNGYDGYNGYNGYNGYDGYNGYNGYNGYSDYDGYPSYGTGYSYGYGYRR